MFQHKRATPHPSPVVATLLLGAACAAGPTSSPTAMYEQGGRQIRRGIVIPQPDLASTATLLEALKGRIPSLRIVGAGGMCPAITLRGQQSIGGYAAPSIYVDDARASNTCILQEMTADDVARVEVYPGGSAGIRYPSNPAGIIVVVTRQH